MNRKNIALAFLTSSALLSHAMNFPNQDAKCVSDENCNEYFESCVFPTPRNSNSSLPYFVSSDNNLTSAVSF